MSFDLKASNDFLDSPTSPLNLWGETLLFSGDIEEQKGTGFQDLCLQDLQENDAENSIAAYLIEAEKTAIFGETSFSTPIILDQQPFPQQPVFAPPAFPPFQAPSNNNNEPSDSILGKRTKIHQGRPGPQKAQKTNNAPLATHLGLDRNDARLRRIVNLYLDNTTDRISWKTVVTRICQQLQDHSKILPERLKIIRTQEAWKRIETMPVPEINGWYYSEAEKQYITEATKLILLAGLPKKESYTFLANKLHRGCEPIWSQSSKLIRDQRKRLESLEKYI